MKAATCPDRVEYQKVASGEVSVAEKEALLRHAESCDNCAQLLSSMPEQEKLVAVIRQAQACGDFAESEVVDRLVRKLSGLRPPEAGPDERTLPPLDTASINMLSFPCPACSKTLKVKAAAEGKKAKCPHCQAPLQVPGPMDERTIPPLQAPRPDEPRTLGSQKGGTTGGDPVEHGFAGNRELYDFLSPAQQPDEIGRLGEYRVLKVLGAGGMGVVFQAEDPKLKRKVALKAMLPVLAASESARLRFLREAQTAAAIEHDHIVPILHVAEDRGVPFIVMPFLKGEPLDSRLDREKSLPLTEVLRIGRETAKGLSAAHAAGLVHRDIKPANLWLEGEEGRVKILDFGLARAAADNANLTQQGAIIGTPAYMAPEQAQGQMVDGRCDLFSLGCVLYRASTGKPPFKGTDTVSTLVAVATENPTPPRNLRPELSAEFSALVLRLLAKNPAERPATAGDAAAALQELEAADKGQAPSGTGKTPASRVAPEQLSRKKRNRSVQNRLPATWLVGGGMLALGLLAAAIVLLWPTPKGTVRIESNDPDVEIVFDRNGPTIKGADKEPLSLRAGEHGVLIKRGDFSFEADKFVLKKDQTITLQLEWLPGQVQVSRDGKVIASRTLSPTRDGKVIAAPATPLSAKFKNSLGMEFVLVTKGKLPLGGSGGKPGQTLVAIDQDFYLGVYEVTQEQWQAVMKANPSGYSRGGAGKEAVKDIPDEELKRFPVEHITWHDAKRFVEVMNTRERDPAWKYSLPTSAQWEYACRGGAACSKAESGFDFYFDKPTSDVRPDQANFGKWDKCLNRPCKVGSYKPNRLGLYDMHGNVWEWCEDAQGTHRVNRGGSWFHDYGYSSANGRFTWEPSAHYGDLGLRLARVRVGKDDDAPP